mmetsp:Transcript_27241/g.57278  ORF Transcript_27241/g.57278 Transcript_27241/m.57278 type:complete len:81 (-) Transcript_27241:517-759(-)
MKLCAHGRAHHEASASSWYAHARRICKHDMHTHKPTACAFMCKRIWHTHAHVNVGAHAHTNIFHADLFARTRKIHAHTSK